MNMFFFFFFFFFFLDPGKIKNSILDLFLVLFYLVLDFILGFKYLATWISLFQV